MIADNTWAALQGRKKLKIEWGPAITPATIRLRTRDAARTARKPGRVAREVGNVDAEFAKGGKVLEAAYYTPMLAHAPMEPPAAVAEFRDGKVETWAATQNPQAVQDTVAKALGINKEDVICHVTLLGGGFGRKSKPDYVAEAAMLSKKVGKPVKIVWSREDDIHFDYYHSPAGMYIKAAVNDKGQPTAWLQRTRLPADRHAEQSRRAVRRLPARHGLDRHTVSDPQSPRGKRTRQGARPHRLAALGGEYLSRVRACNRSPMNWPLPRTAIAWSICWN